MNFKEASELAEKSQNLVGKKYNGATIDEVLIYPSNPVLFKQYCGDYILCENAHRAVTPYLNTDLKVGIALEKRRISRDSIFLYKDIETLRDSDLN